MHYAHLAHGIKPEPDAPARYPGRLVIWRYPVWLTALLPVVLSFTILGGCAAFSPSTPDHNSNPGGASSPAQVAESAEGSAYIIGPEDVLEVSVWKNPDLSQELAVRPDGKISFKLVGEIPAQGMTIAELREELTRRYQEYIPAAEVSVTLKEMNSFKVYILGRIAKPGEYKVNSRLSVLQALALAGGFTPYAHERKIKIFRRVGDRDQILDFDYKKVVRGEAGDLELQPGDRVVVP